ncbi:MAG: histidine--tRNA ligase [Candidatus Cloacimonetes bacterium]|nr:histidine--tRNA ligase [Candidatus Cloacimonadota bacterium]
MAVKYTVPRGTQDILPKDSYKWEYMEMVFRKVAKSYGYQEINTPVFEQTEVFERSAGDSTDIVQKEMYRFQDKKGRNFALRPEGTAPVIRSYIENNLGSEGHITKLFYIEAMFRYDRPQSGRSRQFSQFGCECIGTNHPYYDAENITVFWTYLKTLGLKNFVVEINSIGCSECSETYNTALKDYFKKFIFLPNNEISDLVCPDCQTRYDKNPKRLLDCKIPKCKEISKEAPSMLDYLDDKCKTHFSEVQKYLDILKVPYVINPKIVRGLDYYTQTAFEFINYNLGSQNALGGGGRYDGLIKQMGGKDTPAVGFAGGFSRLLLSLINENSFQGDCPRPKYYIVCANDSSANDENVSSKLTKALELLIFLRNKGIYAEFDIEKISLKAQLKNANRLKAHHVIIIGEEELAKNYLTLKNMNTGEQTTLDFDKIDEL